MQNVLGWSEQRKTQELEALNGSTTSPDTMTPERDRDLLDSLLIGVVIAGALVLAAGFAVWSGHVDVRRRNSHLGRERSSGPSSLPSQPLSSRYGARKRRARQFTSCGPQPSVTRRRLRVCIAIVVFAIAMRMSLFEARASDQWGYVSQAALWARGDLVDADAARRDSPVA